MTKLSYPFGWSARSKVRGKALRPAIARGTSTSTTATQTGTTTTSTGSFAPCVSVSVNGAVSLRDLHTAWLEARRGKRPSHNQIKFETYWLDDLIRLQERLNSGTWVPMPPTCFVATRPKAREIHAPDFCDRVVHHWLVPRLEQIYEPVFIHDSFSNRIGKGTHAAVDRLRDFVRQVESGQGGGWYLQLDVHNFFNSIHRPTLYALLKERMTRYGMSSAVRHATHELLRYSPLHRGAKDACTTAERALIPKHKQLANAAPGCGIAIGNLSSQFFANVYLSELDQFVKHALKAKRYIRYVDDFVLVHQSREQLLEWLAAIERFLQDALGLRLKAEVKLKPISSGIDFLGYILRPTHTIVRRRVVHHAHEKLLHWQQAHVSETRIRATPAQLREIGSVWSSYLGHFCHANSHRLVERMHSQFPWLAKATALRSFDYRLEGRQISLPITSSRAA